MTAGVGALAVVALAACGGSSGGGSSSSTSSKSKTTSKPSVAAVVVTASNAKFGTILVDSQGKTLYTLTSNGKPVACTGACLGVWPALVLPAGTTKATGGKGVTGLGTVTAGSGKQVTQKGAPLYTFSGDQAKGDANGDGINSFGGTWHVVKVGGTGGSSTTSGSSGGSGY